MRSLSTLKGNFFFLSIKFDGHSFKSTIYFLTKIILTLSGRRPLSYRNQSIDLLRKSMGWFLYDNGLRQERLKKFCRHYILVMSRDQLYFRV